MVVIDDAARRTRASAAADGLPDHRARRRLWTANPAGCRAGCLLGGPPENSSQQLVLPAQPAPLHAQVLLDVRRSAHFTECSTWDAHTRATRLTQLGSVLDAVFPEGHGEAGPRAAGAPQYYQGAHDIATVLLLEVGPMHAPRVLRHAVRHGLAGYARTDLAPAATALLDILLLMLRELAPHVGAAVADAGLSPPLFALPWLLTWFAHSVPSARTAARLFDVFLVGHPLLPLYAAAVLLRRCGEAAATAAADAGELHMGLQSLPSLLSHADVAPWLTETLELYRSTPADRILRALPVREHSRLAAAWPELFTWSAAHDDALAGPGGASVPLLLSAARRLGGGDRWWLLPALSPVTKGGGDVNRRWQRESKALLVVALVSAVAVLATLIDVGRAPAGASQRVSRGSWWSPLLMPVPGQRGGVN